MATTTTPTAEMKMILPPNDLSADQKAAFLGLSPANKKMVLKNPANTGKMLNNIMATHARAVVGAAAAVAFDGDRNQVLTNKQATAVGAAAKDMQTAFSSIWPGMRYQLSQIKHAKNSSAYVAEAISIYDLHTAKAFAVHKAMAIRNDAEYAKTLMNLGIKMRDTCGITLGAPQLAPIGIQ